MKRVLVIGGTGMLGHKLVQTLSGRFSVSATIRGRSAEVKRFRLFDRVELLEGVDVTLPGSLERAIEQAKPDVVINCAGVVKQVPEAQNAIATITVNSIVPNVLSELAARYGFRLILISTDCVFRGDRGNYSETEIPDATDLYGRSKILGEVSSDSVLTVRTSLIGREITSSHGLIEWFLGNRGRTVSGYRTAIFSGFPTIVFADIIGDLLLDQPDLCGIYHVSSDPIDKLGLLRLVNKTFDAGIEVIADDSLSVDRSLDSTRFREITGFVPVAWHQMIDRMASDPTPYDEWRK